MVKKYLLIGVELWLSGCIWSEKRKMAVWGGLTNSWGKEEKLKQRRKGEIYPFECIVPKNSKER